MIDKLTSSQRSAVYAKGNVLVSAAAGSGKTAVLVERVINKLTSKNEFIGADRLLIVTFTNAAAAELRSRIEKRLDEIIDSDPYNTALLTQKHLLPNAKICTIDSFCIDLVRENFERAGVSPDFKIVDNSAVIEIDQKVITKILNKYLEKQDQNFLKLLDLIGTEYGEDNFIKFILDIFNASRQLTQPKKWFNQLSSNYSNGVFTENSVWADYAFNLANELVNDIIANCDNAAELLSVSNEASEIFLPSVIELKNSILELKNLANNRDWNAVFYFLNGFNLPKVSGVRKYNDIPQVIASKSIIKNTNNYIERLKSLFYDEKEFISAQFLEIYKPVKLLSEILCEFEDSLFEEYKRLNILTFHNTEHLTLKLLTCEDENGDLIVNPDAAELINRYDEIMVDEYQDTNNLQDLIFKILSNNEKKLFVVGDIKQSIYAFRGANPNIFLEKKQRYVPIEKATPDICQKIILGDNFRCKKQVCNFINYFFEQFMTENTGKIIYDNEERLVASATFPENEIVSSELAFIDTTNCDDKDIVCEARYIAEYIKNVMNEGNVIKADDKTLRAANFSDFTILLRSANLRGPILAKELKNLGIPVNFSDQTLADCSEISIFLSLLKIIDNPLLDVELLTVLMSPIFNFSADEISIIRKDSRNDYLYVSLLNNRDNQKVANFLNWLEENRRLAIITELPTFLSLLLDSTNFLNISSNMPHGARRKANLLNLCDMANQFVIEGNSSISKFVAKILKSAENMPSSVDFGENSVQIMSIHGSKGLQFPVCIVADLAHSFSNDNKKNTIYSVEKGIGFRYYDEALKTKLNTLSRQVILDNNYINSLQEELRLLYVAMTRTKDKLLLVSTQNKLAEKIEFLKNLYYSSDGRINKYVFSNTNSYADWLLLSIFSHPSASALRKDNFGIILNETDSFFNLKIIEAENLGAQSLTQETLNFEPDNNMLNKIKENFSYNYQYKKLSKILAKTSVSRIANAAEASKFVFSAKPDFMENDGLTAAGRGTALHKVMQHFDFSKSDDIKSELERLYEWKFISENEYNSINIEKLSSFFTSSIFKRMKKATMLKREMRFLTEIPAFKISSELENDFKNEKIIIQGAVDACFEEDDSIVILDFKTDYTNNPEHLIAAYGEQLNIYAFACEKIFNKPVKQKIIYSFSLDREIECK